MSVLCILAIVGYCAARCILSAYRSFSYSTNLPLLVAGDFNSEATMTRIVPGLRNNARELQNNAQGDTGGTQGGHVHAFSIGHILHTLYTYTHWASAGMMPHIVAGHHATTLLHSGIMPLYSGLHCGRTPCHQPASHSQWHHAGHHATIIHPSCTQEDHATNATVGKRRWLEF